MYVVGRRSAGRGLVLALALVTALLGLPAPAHAVQELPWRFTTVAQNFQLPYNTTIHVVLQCPEGYRPISGGVGSEAVLANVRNASRFHEISEPNARAYHIGVRHDGSSGDGTYDMRATVVCAWADHVGPVEYVSAKFTRNATTGHGGGLVNCPLGYEVLTGGAIWSGDGLRTIDYFAPVLDDGGRAVAWYATGYSPVSGAQLTVEAYCIPAGYLASAYATVDISDAATANGQIRSAGAQCDLGYRIVTGGAYPWGSTFPTQDRGKAWASSPHSVRNWVAHADLMSGNQLRAVAICAPASTLSVAFTGTPQTLTNSRIAPFSYSISEQTGENITWSCKFDNQPIGCGPAGQQYEGIPDGPHVFSVNVSNQSGRTASATHSWTVDGTPPIVSTHLPAASLGLTSPISIAFSEPVMGVSASAIEVHGQNTNVVAGTVKVTSPSAMTWTPSRPLLPGETYRVSLTEEIHDPAGNALVPTFWDVRTVTKVENTSPALTNRWDVDNRTIASGGAYITSRTEDGAAALTFTAAEGQVASVHGIRLPNGGNADVFVDGVKQATRSFYAASPARAEIFKSAPLEAGSHTITMRPLGTRPSASTGNWVSVDTLTVGTTVRQETAFRQTFDRVSASTASGGSYSTVTHASDSDGAPAYSARVVGSAVKVWGTKTPTSGSARVFVDGVLKKTVNFRASEITYKALMFSTALEDGAHTIRIEPVGTANGSGSAVGVDYITLS